MFCITNEAYPMRHHAGHDAERFHLTQKQLWRAVLR